jgi:copper chaperone CopZ
MRSLLFIILVFAIGCQTQTKKETKTTPPPVEQAMINPAQDAVVFELAVEGMTCTGCEETIKNSVNTLDGIQWIKATHTDGKVVLAMTQSNPDTTGVKQKIEESGYKVVSITPQTAP